MGKIKKYDLIVTVGVFDCFHEGHANIIESMVARLKNEKSRLIILVHDDLSTYKNKKRFPIQRVNHRIFNVSDFVGLSLGEHFGGDYSNLHMQNSDLFEVASIIESDPTEIIKKVYFNNSKFPEKLFLRGDDWKDFPGHEAVEKLGFDIEFVPYTKGVSTTMIREEIKKKNKK